MLLRLSKNTFVRQYGEFTYVLERIKCYDQMFKDAEVFMRWIPRVPMEKSEILKKICAAMDRWKKEGKPLYPVSVNLSRSRMYDENLIDDLVGIVDAYGVDHHLIDFELTESATYDNMEHMLSVLQELRSHGFKISMDDFGTGYSSLSLLTQMQIDTLKIDKRFVDTIAGEGERKEDVIVLQHIITLAKELGFVCLAEGAESRTQVDRLRDLGCEIIQGYYYSKPIPLGEYEERYL